MEKIKYNYLEEFNKLNDAQKQAVETIDGAVLVVAGPGTGKTQILAARITNILQNTDANPENILCMTFTEAGVVAMRNRLHRFIGSDAYRVNIHTFHSFCNKIIQENLDYFSYKELEPISDIQKIELLEELIDTFDKNHPLKRWRGNIYYDEKRFTKLFSLMKTEDLSAEYIEKSLGEYLESLERNPDYIYKRKAKQPNGSYLQKGDVNVEKIKKEALKYAQTIAAAKEYNNYEKLKEKYALYDFDDMILWVLKAFKEDENFLLNYQERFQYFLVDEYQDTNGSQNEILKKLISYWDNPNAFVVGDDDQSIFRFQGANVGNILNFYDEVICKAFPDVEERKKRVIVMTNNYRSTQAILDVSSNSIKNNSERLVNQLNELHLSKDLLAKGANVATSTEKPKITEYYNETQELLGVANKIIELKEAGEDLNEIAVIYKNHRQSEELQKFLNEKEIPVSTKRKINILDQPLTNHLLNILIYITEEIKFANKREDLLFEIMHYPYFKINPLQIARLTYELRGRRAKKPKTTWRETLHSLDKIIDGDSVERIEKLGLLIEKWFADILDMPLQLFFQTIISDIKLIPYVMSHKEKVWKLQELKTFFNFIKQENQKNTKISVTEFLDLISLMQKYKIRLDFVRTTFADKAVKFTTAHSSKGLEFKYVFIIGLQDKVWNSTWKPPEFSLPPNVIQKSKGSDEEEARRLFYVAMTRAKEFLSISYPNTSDTGKDLQASLFISEIIENKNIEFQEKSEKDDEVFDFTIAQMLIAKHENPTLIERKYLEQRLEKYSLSVTHLNNYLKCPLKFYYENFLQIPFAKNAAMAFGSAIHNSIEELFKRMLENNGVFPSVEDFLEIAERKMYGQEDSFTKKDYKKRLDYIKMFLPKYYEKYVNVWNKNIKFEKRLYATYKGIELNGALDKMEFIENNLVNIVDYKTGQASNYFTTKKFKSPLSEEKLKALVDQEKEPSFEDKYGGDYWRQAAFYKILMEHTQDLNQLQWVYNSTTFDFVEPDVRNRKKPNDFVLKPVVLGIKDITIVKQQIEDTYKNIVEFKFKGCGDADCEWCKFEDEYK